jgi:hypothetical protein
MLMMFKVQLVTARSYHITALLQRQRRVLALKVQLARGCPCLKVQLMGHCTCIITTCWCHKEQLMGPCACLNGSSLTICQCQRLLVGFNGQLS